MEAYLYALLAMCLFAAAVLRHERMAATALVLLVDWSFCTAYIAATNDQYPWTIYATVDYSAALTILLFLRAFGRISIWQALIGLIFAAELVTHGNVGWTLLSSGPDSYAARAAQYYGAHFLDRAAWGQLGVIAGWGGYEILMGRGVSLRGISDRLAHLGRLRQPSSTEEAR